MNGAIAPAILIGADYADILVRNISAPDAKGLAGLEFLNRGKSILSAFFSSEFRRTIENRLYFNTEYGGDFGLSFDLGNGSVMFIVPNIRWRGSDPPRKFRHRHSRTFSDLAEEGTHFFVSVFSGS
jgi:hypothetical protein